MTNRTIDHQDPEAMRREAEEARERISAILESITDAFIAFDNEGRLTYINRQAERFLQRPREDLLGKNLWEEFPEAAASRLYEEYCRVVAEQVAVEFEEFYTPLGRWLEVRASPTRDGVTAYFRDITRRKRAEEERALLLAREQAARAEAEAAVRARNDFLSMVTHDLKNPLATIKVRAQMLQHRVQESGLPTTDPILKGLTNIDTTATKMATLLNELLDVARLQIGQPLTLDLRRVDLVALARQVADEQQTRTAIHRIRVEASVATLSADWDPVRLERVLTNLMVNAIQYSPRGGEITMTVRPEEDATGTWAVMQVKDQGVGIAPDELSRIFEQFYRGENAEDRVAGTGIGLASARQIAQQHGGSLTAESEEGVGTTFTVRLPLQSTPE